MAVNRYIQFVGSDCALKAERVQKKKSLENVLTEGEYKIMLSHGSIMTNILQIIQNTIVNDIDKIEVVSQGKGGMEKWFQVEIAWGLIQIYNDLCSQGIVTGYGVAREWSNDEENFYDLYVISETSGNRAVKVIELEVDILNEDSMEELYEMDIQRIEVLDEPGAAIMISDKQGPLPGAERVTIYADEDRGLDIGVYIYENQIR